MPLIESIAKNLAQCASPFKVSINQVTSMSRGYSFAFFFATEIDSSRDMTEADISKVYGEFRDSIMKTTTYLDMEKNLLDQIKHHEETLEEQQKMIAHLQRYETFYQLYKELKHDAPADA